MELDFDHLSAVERYRLMTGLIVPRPIAWITSLSRSGILNAAPFSFFNVLGVNPVVVAIGIGMRSDGSPKDSARNIDETGSFVINLVSEQLGPKMNQSAFEFPPDLDELHLLNLHTEASRRVEAPRISGSPASLECRLIQFLEIGQNRIVLGEVIHVHVADRFFDDSSKTVKTAEMGLIGRMHGSDQYTKTQDLFSMPRLKKEDLAELGIKLPAK